LKHEVVPEAVQIENMPANVTPLTSMAFQLPDREKWLCLTTALAKATSKAPDSFLTADPVAIKLTDKLDAAKTALRTAYKARSCVFIAAASSLMKEALAKDEPWSEQQDACLELLDRFLQSPTSALDIGYSCLCVNGNGVGDFELARTTAMTAATHLRDSFVLAIGVDPIPRQSPVIVNFLSQSKVVLDTFSEVAGLPDIMTAIKKKLVKHVFNDLKPWAVVPHFPPANFVTALLRETVMETVDLVVDASRDMYIETQNMLEKAAKLVMPLAEETDVLFVLNDLTTSVSFPVVALAPRCYSIVRKLEFNPQTDAQTRAKTIVNVNAELEGLCAVCDEIVTVKVIAPDFSDSGAITRGADFISRFHDAMVARVQTVTEELLKEHFDIWDKNVAQSLECIDKEPLKTYIKAAKDRPDITIS